MAVGDVVADCSAAVADAASATIQPGVGVEWVIHNIDFEDLVEIYRTDGVSSILIHSSVADETEYPCARHLTNGDYLTVKNVSGGAIDICWDGVVTG